MAIGKPKMQVSMTVLVDLLTIVTIQVLTQTGLLSVAALSQVANAREIVSAGSSARGGRKSDSREDQVACRPVGAEKVVKEKQNGCLDREYDQNVGQSQGIAELENKRAVNHYSDGKILSSWRCCLMGCYIHVQDLVSAS